MWWVGLILFLTGMRLEEAGARDAAGGAQVHVLRRDEDEVESELVEQHDGGAEDHVVEAQHEIGQPEIVSRHGWDLLEPAPEVVGPVADHAPGERGGGGGSLLGPRTLRDPKGVHGVFVNGVRVFDGKDYVKREKGPGMLLDRFLPARNPALASAAQ